MEREITQIKPIDRMISSNDEELLLYYLTKADQTIHIPETWDDIMVLKAYRKYTKRVLRMLELLKETFSDNADKFYDSFLAYLLSGKITPEDYTSISKAWCRLSHSVLQMRMWKKFFNRFLRNYQQQLTDVDHLLLRFKKMETAQAERKEADD